MHIRTGQGAFKCDKKLKGSGEAQHNKTLCSCSSFIRPDRPASDC